jgi:hypothetical protein
MAAPLFAPANGIKQDIMLILSTRKLRLSKPQWGEIGLKRVSVEQE